MHRNTAPPKYPPSSPEPYLEFFFDFILVRFECLHHFRALRLLYTKRHQGRPNAEREGGYADTPGLLDTDGG